MSKQARNRPELAVEAQASYLFTNFAFVFNPFMYRLYISARNEVLHFLAWQAICLEEKLQEYRLLWAHVKQPFVTIKTQGKAGLTSLAFTQLGPGRPSGPPYLHSVYAWV